MKTRFGSNQRWIIRPESRQALRAIFVDVLGATVASPSPTLDIYTLSDGGNVGIFVEDQALDEASARLGTWLEFVVEDVDAAASALEAAGARRIDFRDKSHHYLQAPGGPVFRLARG